MLIVDVSNVNGTLDWAAIAKTPNLEGAYVKVTEGRDYDDLRAAYNLHAARQHGLEVGGYHFARPDRNPPEVEANHFYGRLANLPACTLRPVLDLEVPGHTGAESPEAWARAFNARFHYLSRTWPMFYSYRAFIDAMAPASPIGGGLWLADYGPNNGHPQPVNPPSPWRKIALHQFTSKGRVNGHAGNVDLSTRP